MEYKYPVSRPSLKGRELEYVTNAIRSGWISSQGPEVKLFEDAFANWNKVNHGVACSSGTAALTLALRALGIREGDEVIVPEFTMVATAWAVTYTGAKPVFVDCRDDLNIDVDLIEEKITPRTKAIIPVHIYGRRCDMEKIMEIAHEYNLRVIEDSAEAHGVKPVADIACFSLFANKIISSGEGGICLTNDLKLAEQMRHLRSMGFSKEHTFLHKKLAYNFRMTNVQAAIARAQVERIDEILLKRKKIEETYDKLLTGVRGLQMMPKRSVLWYYDILVDKKDELMKWLEEQGIETRMFFKPMSQQPMYYDSKWRTLKAATFSSKGIYLPTYTDIRPEDQYYIVKGIRDFYGNKR